ncbi:endonuclease/exonuclease/phosphatase family protein [Luteolibacter arcticus]|uniref:Endonuclease/exonuclease/phosphatase family protein n=1 Tax=Luteolibacter arcticus TaxID=1581411 RepID=A0ABT3GPS7_9BACT|nr:endonuclease/exonuclease/phosphatase family protein [Luteolibacter arcticus]MCW1925515.1 endonuclease/exonuclease/phosphatase family protein [Luteolibacter arcticus]
MPHRWKPLLKAIAGGSPGLLLGIAALGTAGSPLGIWSSHVERMSHFRWWWIGMLVLLAAWFFRKRRRALAATAVALIAWAAVPLAPYWISRPAATDEKGLTFLAWNVLWENPTKELAMPWLSHQDADVLLLTECTDDWRERLAPLKEKYPHQISSGRDGAEGMWLLSRHPLDAPDPDGLAAAKPWISTVMHAPGGPVRVIGMHPRTPRSGPRFDQRNEQYDRAAGIASNAGMPVVLLGDLNCTPYSPWFQRLLKRGKLRDSALGFGLHSTWRSNGIGLPIDHILVSDHWQVQSRTVSPDRMGSDHHPVVAVLSRKAP